MLIILLSISWLNVYIDNWYASCSSDFLTILCSFSILFCSVFVSGGPENLHLRSGQLKFHYNALQSPKEVYGTPETNVKPREKQVDKAGVQKKNLK